VSSGRRHPAASVGDDLYIPRLSSSVSFHDPLAKHKFRFEAVDAEGPLSRLPSRLVDPRSTSSPARFGADNWIQQLLSAVCRADVFDHAPILVSIFDDGDRFADLEGTDIGRDGAAKRFNLLLGFKVAPLRVIEFFLCWLSFCILSQAASQRAESILRASDPEGGVRTMSPRQKN
jgi:hypothetical protein